MQNLISFWCCLFWVTIVLFITNLSNIVKLVFYSELVWIVFYCYVIIIGSLNDDITLLTSGFFILGFAGLEYSIGILIILLYKNINNNINLFDNEFKDKEFFLKKNKNILNNKNY